MDLPPIRKAHDRETRRRVLDEIMASARGRATPGPDAARSQDFLYEDNGDDLAEANIASTRTDKRGE